MLDEPSTISRWLSQPGDIHLRRYDHGPDPQEGKEWVLAVVVGLVLLIGGAALLRWLA